MVVWRQLGIPIPWAKETFSLFWRIRRVREWVNQLPLLPHLGFLRASLSAPDEEKHHGDDDDEKCSSAKGHSNDTDSVGLLDDLRSTSRSETQSAIFRGGDGENAKIMG